MLDQLRAQYLFPDTDVYNDIIDAELQHGHAPSAFGTFEKLGIDQREPNARTFALLMNARAAHDKLPATIAELNKQRHVAPLDVVNWSRSAAAATANSTTSSSNGSF